MMIEAMFRLSSTLFFAALLGVAAFFLLQGQSVAAVGDMSRPDEQLVPLTASQNDKSSWSLVFHDEFNGDHLDTSLWVTCYWWDKDGCTNLGNRELEWYQPGNVIVQNGVLKLEARKESIRASDGRTYPYTSGMVTTGRSVYEQSGRLGFAFQYGYVEVRARIPKGKGLWPAIWLLPTTHESRPEIDIMEVLGHETTVVHMNMHYQRPGGGRGRTAGSWTTWDLSTSWHTYAVEWRPDAVIWYIDGKPRRAVTDTSIIPATPMYLILNLAVGGNWPGAPNDATPFPSSFQIDYVRIWMDKEHISR
jgi:beta-glucanase (GH16 family)